MKAKILALALSSLMLCSYASADVIYTNGNAGDQYTPAQISDPQSVTDSFMVMGSNQVNLTDAVFGAWTPQGAVPTKVTWSIGTSRFGSDVSSGTADLTNDFQYTTGNSTDGFYDVYSSSFALTGLLNAGQTYWFTLSNGMSDTDGLGWGVNNGPSTAFYTFPDQPDGTPGETGSIPSEYFQLNGTLVQDTGNGGTVPEPASLAIFGLGLAGLAAVRRRKQAV